MCYTLISSTAVEDSPQQSVESSVDTTKPALSEEANSRLMPDTSASGDADTTHSDDTKAAQQ